MLDSLKFVRGVIGKQSLVQELNHYVIREGRITGTNGPMALSSPIDLTIEAYPDAASFAKAIAACSDKTSIHMTAAGRLAIRSGKFKAFIDCLEEPSFIPTPEGEKVNCPQGFLENVKQLTPFIGEDATRPWSMGLLMVSGTYMTTNNIMFVQKWTGHKVPAINIPRPAIQELLRIGVDPTHIQIAENNISFLYENDRWLRTQTYAQSWPEKELGIINRVLAAEVNPVSLPEELSDALDTLLPFFRDKKGTAVYFEDGNISNHLEQEMGIHVEVEGAPQGVAFNIHQLRLLCQVANTVDWSLYPSPILFFGDNIRGAMAAMVVNK